MKILLFLNLDAEKENILSVWQPDFPDNNYIGIDIKGADVAWSKNS